MRAWVNGLLGKGAAMLGAATLLPGNTGAARAISGAACAQPFGIDNPPNRCADASWALIPDTADRIWPVMPPIMACNLLSTSWDTLPNIV